MGGAWVVVLAAIALTHTSIPEGFVRFAAAEVFMYLALALPVTVAVLWAASWLGELGYERRDLILLGGIVALTYSAAAILIHVYFSAEHDIKTYDSTVYWIKVIEDGRLFAESIPGYLGSLRHSFTFEYNDLAAFPLLPLSHLTGTGFAGYCLSVVFAYYLPACFFLTVFALRIHSLAQGTRPGIPAFVACFSLCALCVGFLWPVMDGYLDVVGALITALLLNLTLHWDVTKYSWRAVLELAVLSVLLVLSRRWYAFYVVGFYFSFGVAALCGMLGGREFTFRKLGVIVLNMGAIAAVSTVCLLLLHPALLELFLSNRYSVAYSFYKTMSLWGNFWDVSKNLGVLWLAAAYGGVSLLLASGKTRLVCLRLLLAVVVAVVLFCRIQDMGYHHHYLVYPTLLILAGVFYARVGELASRKRGAAIALYAALLGVTLANFLYGYAPGLRAIAAKTEPFTTVMRRYPKVNENYDTVKKLVRDLTKEVGATSRHVYVVGDGAALSPEILKRSSLPETTDAAPYVLVNSIVDLRDGFPSQLFMADYVIVSDPFITEMPQPQQVSLQPNEMMLYESATAAYYRREATYPAPGGDLVVMKKTRPIDAAYVNIMKERIRAVYPENPFVYKPNYFVALNDIDPAISYTYNLWDDNSFKFHKKPEEEITIRLHGVGDMSSLAFAISCWNAGLELRVENQDGVLARQPLTREARVPYRFSIEGSDSIAVTIVNASPDEPIPATFILHHPEMD